MADCSKTYDYIHERERMCKCYVGCVCCDGCPFSKDENGFEVYCADFELYHTASAILALQKWSNAHPRKGE